MVQAWSIGPERRPACSTVAGGVLYDPAYVSNPLVFAGCIGVAPADRPPLTGPHPGDRIIVFGGRTGRDGIRGATFSSM